MAVRRDIAAHHEAAQAVVARVQGVEVVGVMMFPTDDRTPSSTLAVSAAYHAGADAAARIAGLETDIRIKLAGPCANARYGKGRHSPKVKDGEANDIGHSNSMAVEIALLLTGEPIPHHHDGMQMTVDYTIVESAQAISARLRAETGVLLAEHWPAVERVAQALMTRDLLDQTELDRLIAAR